MKRTPLKRRTPLRTRGRRAEREAPALAEFQATVHARRWCELGPPACEPNRHEGHHAHHIVRRSQGGGHRPDNGLLCCALGHQWIHAHPEHARELGWLGRRTA